MDTSNVLFICGGTFSLLEKIIERRITNKTMGFGAPVESGLKKKIGEILRFVETEDLLKFGFIPEFIGRFAVTATLEGLDEDDLVRVLTEPKNALVKQFTKFFKMENVSLKFMPEALRAVAREAMRKKTGARALRMILEEMMLEVMYEIPSDEDIAECIITEEAVQKKTSPILIRKDGWKRAIPA